MHISADASADSRSIYRSSIGRLSVDNRWTDISADSRLINVYISGDALVDYRSIYRSTIGRLSVDFRSTIGRLSAYMSTEATYSTHDPCVLDFSHHHDVLHLVAV